MNDTILFIFQRDSRFDGQASSNRDLVHVL